MESYAAKTPFLSLQGCFTSGTEYRLQQIGLDKITYIEGLKDYVKIHLTGDSSPILSLMRMKTLEDTLPASDFVRVHKSFIVRLDKIEAIERNHILISTARIPIGDSYQSPLFSALSGTSIIPPEIAAVPFRHIFLTHHPPPTSTNMPENVPQKLHLSPVRNILTPNRAC